MSLPQIVREDFLCMDGIETVTYQSRLADDSYDSGTHCKALMRPPSKRLGSPAVTGIDSQFFLDAVSLAMINVAPGGRIVQANGRTWEVVSATLEKWQTQWRCEVAQCRE